MALAPAPTPFASAPTFPGNAEYQANVAALEHQYQTELAGDQEAMKDDWRNATYQRALMGKGEPNALQTNEEKENKAGLLESGVNANRRAQIATAYGQKRAGLTLKIGEQENDTAHKEKVQGENTTNKLGQLVANATEKRKAEFEASPAREPNAGAEAPVKAPVNAGGTVTNVGTAGAGGVVPYTEKSPAGTVKVGEPPPPPSKPLFGERAIVNPGTAQSYILAANGEHYPNTEWNRGHPKQMRK
jgi:hypothetical protein